MRSLALAAILLLVTVAPAGATVTSGVAGSKLTVSGDGQPDAIDLGVAEGRVAVNGTATTLAADGSAEIVVESGGGGDLIDAGGLAVGTYGSLTLRGGDGNDVLSGGQGGDLLSGNAGFDRLAGDGGVDRTSGGEADDVTVWNSGDGSEEALGEAGFDRLEVNGSATSADEFQLLVIGQVTKVEGANPPFAIELPNDSGEFEEVSFAGGGGDDRFTVSPGLARLFVSLDGAEGDDALFGSEEFDSIVGGPGNDTLLAGGGSDRVVGGTGEDMIAGEGGDDRLVARDRQRDLVDGGPGDDSAETDEVTLDSVGGVEHLDATQPPGPPAPPTPPSPPAPPTADTLALLPRLGKVTVARRARGLVAKVPLSCPAEEAGGCRTTVTVTARAARPGNGRGVVALGSKTVRLAPGGGATASIRIAPGAAKLAVNGRLPARIRIASTDAAGNTAAATVAVILRLPRTSVLSRKLCDASGEWIAGCGKDAGCSLCRLAKTNPRTPPRTARRRRGGAELTTQDTRTATLRSG